MLTASVNRITYCVIHLHCALITDKLGIIIKHYHIFIQNIYNNYTVLFLFEIIIDAHNCNQLSSL